MARKYAYTPQSFYDREWRAYSSRHNIKGWHEDTQVTIGWAKYAINLLAEKFGVPVPAVSHKRGVRTIYTGWYQIVPHYYYGKYCPHGRIHFSCKNYEKLVLRGTVLHEFAHHIAHHYFNEGGHGCHFVNSIESVWSVAEEIGV